MMLLSQRGLLAIAAVVDVAMHARPAPVSAKALASRHELPPRHLETLLQTLVRAGILKGVRGPRGGYELARERRRLTMGEIVRAALSEADDKDKKRSPLVDAVLEPLVADASDAFLTALDAITVDDLCKRAGAQQVFGQVEAKSDFTI